ncbi:MAG: dTDP-4-dehydrorhamnose reductase [Chitinophagaceae bacterium]
MPSPVIMVTGANGQLGMEIRDLAARYKQFRFIFLAREDLPVHQFDQVQHYFKTVLPAYCINCAAYTAVDKAETERETAVLVNAGSVDILSAACKSFNARFIHISTDYVFDGAATLPYSEDDLTSPVNYYGATKLEGEKLALKNNSETIIIRTSWVYSEFGNNFVKTMMRLMKERTSLNVVNDQVGSPTYAADLAKAILDIIRQSEMSTGKWAPGIYHYSNDGIISWYDFAVAIKTLTGSSCTINPIPTTAYPTPAKRPAYAVFNKDKIKSTYHLDIRNWKAALSDAIIRLTK